jgi:hypothetical protein
MSLEGRLGARRLALVQALGVAALLTAVAVLVYGEHALDGGWIGDAWLTRAWYVLYPHGDFFATVGHFLDLDSMAARPANAVYRVALNGWFGADTGAWYAWQIGSGICMCLAIYALMRELGMRYLDAAAVVTLLVVFPASSSMWLWSPIVNASLSIALGAIGFLLALRGFRAAGRRRLLLHGASLLLFVLSLLLYEVCLPFFLASFLVYALRAPRREAAARWLLDCLVILPLALLVSGASGARGSGVGGAVDHAWNMASQLPGLLLGTLLPFAGTQALAFVLMLALYGWAGWTVRRRAEQDPLRRRLRALLAIAGAGLVVVLLGYLIYVPGLDYYRPLAEGIADRVNAVAALGWTLFLYATLALLATLVTQKLPRATLVAAGATAALALALGLSWVPPIEDESRDYVAAYEEGERMLDLVERAVPDPRPGTAIWTFGQPVEISPGIPVFANSWNMSAAVALRYRRHTVRSFVGFLGTRFQCTADGVIPAGHPEYPPPPPGELGRFGSRYGRTYFLDTVNGQFAPINSRTRCLELRQAFPRATEFPPGT